MELFWSTERVAEHLHDPAVRIVDCRFSLEEDLRAAYLAGHVPGAVYLNWANDISAPPPPSGHPRWMLAGPEEFARAMARIGVGDETMVVGYDAEGGHHAARLWLGLRRYGHDRMSVMEGGIQKWIGEGRPLEKGELIVRPATVTAPSGLTTARGRNGATIRGCPSSPGEASQRTDERQRTWIVNWMP